VSTVVTCPNGHHFPVNSKKHIYRQERYCPHPGCRAKVIVRDRLGRFNPKWEQEKRERAEERQMLREAQRGLPPQQIIQLPFINPLLASIITRRKMEKEKEAEDARET